MVKRQALFPGRRHALGDPALEFLDGLATDAELDEMKWHAATFSARRRILEASLVIGRGRRRGGRELNRSRARSSTRTAFWPQLAPSPRLPVALTAAVQPVPARARAEPAPGSGVMMLTGGVEAADGNSALVGLPVGIDGKSAATGAAAAIGAGVFHEAEYRITIPS